MAVKVLAVRHGESLAHAGIVTLDPAGIGLTGFGVAQAQALAGGWRERPSRVISSPARRAMQTAEPTLARFAGLVLEQWPVQEFRHLSPPRCAGSSVFERRSWLQAYWDRGDAHDDEGGAESFAAFIDRVDECRARLDALPDAGLLLLFSHGQFINAMRWRDYGQSDRLDMRAFRDFDLEYPVLNCQPVSLFRAPESSPRAA